MNILQEEHSICDLPHNLVAVQTWLLIICRRSGHLAKRATELAGASKELLH